MTFQMFQIETALHFYTVGAKGRREAIALVAHRESTRNPVVNFFKVQDGCFTSREGILSQERI
jgi:hypothetical protein